MARGLGKGINAFFPELESKDEDSIQEISTKECRPNPYQPRKTFHADAIEELKESIIQHGILQPLIVRKSIKGYEIVVGERRFRAAKEAGLDKVPVVVKELTDEKMMELALLENLQREDLTPIEEAYAYSNLMRELKITQEELAKRLGKSRPHIANIVRLLTLPEQVSALINNGELSMGHGRAILGLKDKDKLIPLVEKIRKEELNVRQVEQLIIKINENSTQKKQEKPKKDIFLAERESLLRDQLGTGVKIHKGKRKGKIEIDFFSDEDLDRILELFQS
ncbi:ParB/RepB/Spo0J family partition protein [Aquibacillus sp. 3ASR75-11]|uniref:ParB/RepB/Spo0J family partition protein n=1 Tax=Terrihalobacillus insolitus TaxID=2950438 RepID=A0A9X4ANM9_9BACI|nr:ParB/RepB/Spo0J family partition protein [Terrihalobacillus insolitus]MDC3414919.1 ParB/RepB/Spo0J family partition protein [Terrihalobacillus insolitus]MDC3425994.1 ParB/RepB/Spo0J family partition protein [Terrihalobacillus insolitus]